MKVLNSYKNTTNKMIWKERGGLDLDERKLKILQAIIRNYLETGEPVGSRTISKYTDLNLSSATIRNEMADLEELGYIIQPLYILPTETDAHVVNPHVGYSVLPA